MKTLTMIAVAALVAAPALAQQGTVHDPFRRPSIAESRIDQNFYRQQEDAARLRAETREDMQRGRDRRDPQRDLPKWERDRPGHWEWRR